MLQPSCGAPSDITPHFLAQLGQRFGIHYLVDQGLSPHQAVATGHVQDARLSPALHLTLSDLQVHRGYRSTSCHSVPWFISVILEGHIALQYEQQRLTLHAGESVCVHLNGRHPLQVHQPAQPRLRTINLAVLATTPLGLVAPPTMPTLHVWQLPMALMSTLCTMTEQSLAHWRQALVWQGIALQLIGQGLPDHGVAPLASSGLSTRDHQRLAALRTRIAQHPAAHYRLSELAKEVAMSPSSLRQKFHACFGCSLFDYIRQVRLKQAYEALLRGESVQQVAYRCGYRHASNFSTAFKRHFGFTPHELQRPRA